jgi:hypothetical protein
MISNECDIHALLSFPLRRSVEAILQSIAL